MTRYTWATRRQGALVERVEPIIRGDAYLTFDDQSANTARTLRIATVNMDTWERAGG
jgi:hypothetical protein